MRLLHTSDWHLGRALHGRRRYDEQARFLDWLAATVDTEDVDVVLVAGDVFDTGTPSNRAQELYYRFLERVAAPGRRHVVVIAANHDSPSFLSAPGTVLGALDIHVTGAPGARPEDDVLLLHAADGRPALLVCAVPYLRDRDLRRAEAGESIEDKDRKMIAAIEERYARAVAAAVAERERLGAAIPIVATGHLFTAGGRTVEGDGVRDLYVGSLIHVHAEIFAHEIDYLALGHLHAPQRVAGSETMRYSGAPLAMGFGDAARPKVVCLVEFSGTGVGVREIEVPQFQPLARVAGDYDTIATAVKELAAAGSKAWIEVSYEGDEVVADLRERLAALVADTDLEILRVRNQRVMARVLKRMEDEHSLDDLDVHEVFARCLAAHEVPDSQRPELTRLYREIVAAIHDDDPGAR